MRLAGHLKWPSLAGGLERISSQELTEWMALERIEPWGDEWRQTGVICSTIAAGQGLEISPEKFMPIRPREMDPQEIEARCRAFVLSVGGKVIEP